MSEPKLILDLNKWRIEWDKVAILYQWVGPQLEPKEYTNEELIALAAEPMEEKAKTSYDLLLWDMIDYSWKQHRNEPITNNPITANQRKQSSLNIAIELYFLVDILRNVPDTSLPDIPRNGFDILKKIADELIKENEIKDHPPILFSDEDLRKLAALSDSLNVKILGYKRIYDKQKPRESTIDIQPIAPDIKKKPVKRHTRPAGIEPLSQIRERIRVPGQGQIMSLMRDVATLPANSWEKTEYGYELKTHHGAAYLNNVNTTEYLRMMLDYLKYGKMKYAIAVWFHICDAIKKKYGTFPESVDDIDPIKIIVSDLLHSMGKKPDGNSYSREQQEYAWRCIIAQSMVSYAEMIDSDTLRIEPFINIRYSDIKKIKSLFGDNPDHVEFIVNVLPGGTAYNHMRKCYAQINPVLLALDDKCRYEFIIGLYLQCCSGDDEYITFGEIERESGVSTFDTNNPRRRMINIEKALKTLAKYRIIPGDSQGEPLIMKPEDRKYRDVIERKQSWKVKISASHIADNGYRPRPIIKGN